MEKYLDAYFLSISLRSRMTMFGKYVASKLHARTQAPPKLVNAFEDEGSSPISRQTWISDFSDDIQLEKTRKGPYAYLARGELATPPDDDYSQAKSGAPLYKVCRYPSLSEGKGAAYLDQAISQTSFLSGVQPLNYHATPNERYSVESASPIEINLDEHQVVNERYFAAPGNGSTDTLLLPPPLNYEEGAIEEFTPLPKTCNTSIDEASGVNYNHNNTDDVFTEDDPLFESPLVKEDNNLRYKYDEPLTPGTFRDRKMVNDTHSIRDQLVPTLRVRKSMLPANTTWQDLTGDSFDQSAGCSDSNRSDSFCFDRSEQPQGREEPTPLRATITETSTSPFVKHWVHVPKTQALQESPRNMAYYAPRYKIRELSSLELSFK